MPSRDTYMLPPSEKRATRLGDFHSKTLSFSSSILAICPSYLWGALLLVNGTNVPFSITPSRKRTVSPALKTGSSFIPSLPEHCTRRAATSTCCTVPSLECPPESPALAASQHRSRSGSPAAPRSRHPHHT